MSVNWSTAAPPDMFAAFLNAYERGRDAARRSREALAHAAFAGESGPDYPDVFEHLPDEEAAHRVAGAAHVISAFGHGLLSRPPKERRGILEHAKPALMDLGLSGKQIDAFHPSDDNLKRVVERLRPLIDRHESLHPGVFGQGEDPEAEPSATIA